MTPESPPGFLVRTEAQRAAWVNGYRVTREADGPWLRYASTTARGSIWIAGVPPGGPWFVSVDHPGVAAELAVVRAASPASLAGPGMATFVVPVLLDLYAAVERIYHLAVSLPDAPLDRFRNETAAMSRTTEAERLVVQRVGQAIFRDALLDYWNRRCPMTGITDVALLRASHIVPWAECDDEQRLDVHNGLLLAAHWDAAFDAHLVSFTDEGEPIVSPRLSQEARVALALDRSPCLSNLTRAHLRNLASHRGRLADGT